MRWSQRIKTDFLLAKPQYRAKTTEQAIRSVFAFGKNSADTVNPKFILNGDTWYAKSVENLVLAVRGLSAKNYQNAHQSMRRIPLFNSIVQVLREWDIETLDRELSQLQREPRDRSFADFGPLLQVLLKPLFRLTMLNPHVHLLPAITKMYELARMYSTNSDERDILQRYYSIARDEVPLVVNSLRTRMFPVLLKILSEEYMEQDQFYLDRADDILALIGIQDNELIRDMPGSMQLNEGEAQPEQKEYQAPTPKLARQGFVLLDQLFPRAGFLALGDNPDLFSYFQTVLALPKGSDLIPVDDPIQVILPISEILQNLFFGFQNMQWGTMLNQAGEVVRLQEEIDKMIARWHFFVEEFFSKQYLPLLMEYCREIERSGPLSPDSKRREHQLIWFKRNYLLPSLNIPVLDDVRPKSLGYPNLSVQVKEMIDLLAPVAVEAEQKGKQLSALMNPEVKVRFPVENIVSQRFQNALRNFEVTDKGEKRLVDGSNNKALLFYTLAILTALDYGLSLPGSPFYLRKPKFLYRTSGLPNDDKPVYNAPQKNSLLLLKKLNEQPPKEVGKSVPWMGKLGELYGPFIANEEIKTRIHEFHADKVPFCISAFRVLEERFAKNFPVFVKPLLDAGTDVRAQDDGSWFYIMRDTVVEEAEDFSRKVLAAAARANPPLALAALVVPFHTSWTTDKLASLMPIGWKQAVNIPPQALGVYANPAQSFEFRSDVATVIQTAPEDEPQPTLDELPEV